MWTFTIRQILKCFAFLGFAVLHSFGSLQASTIQYRVGVGDVLNIQVLGEKEFSGIFRVGSDGTIDYPYLRKIEVKEKTTEDLAKSITAKLKKGYLLNPQVNVEVKEYNSQRVLLLGAIAKPGQYILKQDTRVLDIISRAGGISALGGKRILLLRDSNKSFSEKNTELMEEKKITPEDQASAVMKSDVKPIVIDYFRLVHQGDFSQNLLLENGDILNIPKANEIFVLGNVARPGPIIFEDNMTILQAVTLAGGPTPTASTKSTYILRQDESGETKIRVRLDKILDNKEKNVALQADDVIVVPESFF